MGRGGIYYFKRATVTYYQACLTLARKMVRVFALALDQPEDAFDGMSIFLGANGTINFYPPIRVSTENENGAEDSIGIGSHTDIQSFTLLYQDDVGGLNIINLDNEWIEATPVPGTFIVNIGDFLMRTTNDRWKSTVHRVNTNRSEKPRMSLPLFFGFNLSHRCAVLDSCIDSEHPAKYPPYVNMLMNKFFNKQTVESK
ncbi:hypothetical protein MPDQ_001444 [Monascus purpureus]|uniref:Fe2OG dioxygenase domain-containing protein n=1 Tax=Monascus purpureus TaxID=5098 RepID=A0A507R3W1_MONPU|nr:hypothetical protein MPDQ_001444 [Monascus purpureus]